MANLEALKNTSVPKLEVRPIMPATAYLTQGHLWNVPETQKSAPMGALPAYCFYIHHPTKNVSLLWDISIRKDIDNHSPVMRQVLPAMQVQVKYDVADFLPTKGISVDSIKHIILSHIHFDHTGNPSTFPSSEVIVGQDTFAAHRPAYPVNPNSPLTEDISPEGRTRELTAAEFTGVSSQGVGPFPASDVYDFFGDGSLLILNAPGHTTGHQIALVRAEKGWVLLGGDCCHHESQTFLYRTEEMCWVMHEDKEKAKEVLSKIEVLRKVAEEEGVKVTFAPAHVHWFEEWVKF